jgi:hypothetical protein
MKKLASLAIIPLFAGFIWAQDQTTRTETTTTTTTLNGTLVDAGCYTTHTESKETTSTTSANETRTTTKTQSSNKVGECPVTTTTTSFGLLTPKGEYVRFDDSGNTKIVEIVKGNKVWTREITNRAPIKVRVVGKHSGDVIVLDSIQ